MTRRMRGWLTPQPLPHWHPPCLFPPTDRGEDESGTHRPTDRPTPTHPHMRHVPSRHADDCRPGLPNRTHPSKQPRPVRFGTKQAHTPAAYFARLLAPHNNSAASPARPAAHPAHASRGISWPQRAATGGPIFLWHHPDFALHQGVRKGVLRRTKSATGLFPGKNGALLEFPRSNVRSGVSSIRHFMHSTATAPQA